MARIPAATRERVPADQRETFDELMSERGGRLPMGPDFIMMNVPEVLKRGQHLREYLARESTLSPKIRELAMLTTAREMDAAVIWHYHAALGRSAGLSNDTVNSLRDKKELTGLPEDEAAVVNYGQEFFRTHRVSQTTFDAALAQFGVRGLTELTNLMGYYALLAFNINAFEVEVPADGTEPEMPI